MASTSAAPQTGIRWGEFSDNFMSPLDGQGPPPVHNTTGCVWNDQDELTLLGTGNLTGTTSQTVCLVADFDDSARGNYPKRVIVQVYAPSDSLDVTLSNDAGHTWPITSRPSGNLRLWELCVPDPVADLGNVDRLNPLTFWPEIPGTNGGRGQIVNYTLTLTSNQRTTRKVAAYFEVAQGGNLGTRYNTLRSTPCPPNDGQ